MQTMGLQEVKKYFCSEWNRLGTWSKFALVYVIVACSGMLLVYIKGLSFEQATTLILLFVSVPIALIIILKSYRLIKKMAPVALLASFFLAIGAFPDFDNPSYFQMLHLVVPLASFFVAYKMFRMGKEWLGVLFAIIGLLFNPAFPVHLRKEEWQMVDGLVAVLFVWVGFQKRKDLRIIGIKKNTSII